MKIAIQKSSHGSFTKKWIEYCEANKISYKLVNYYSTNVLKDLEDCDIIMWHTHHLYKKDYQVAKRLLSALEQSGKICFPSIYENWHYDDKVGQKYLLESINAPLIPSYVFYDKEEAIAWAKNTNWPKVFKLTGGAGSSNVKLIHSENQARKVIHRAFGKGFKIMDQKKYYFEELISKYKKNKSIFKFIKGLYHLTKPTNKNWVDHIEKDYVYFQDFIPKNDYDSRIIVVNQTRVFGYKRFNRKDDFRASGSGEYVFYTPENVDYKVLKLALEVSQKLNMNSIAFDIIYDQNQNPLIIEITYAYGTKGANKAPGYWDKSLNWHEGVLENFQYWMVENVIEEFKKIK
jgi:glutathione synthase/RimK-type ligase-like ATP-grasp enzyme